MIGYWRLNLTEYNCLECHWMMVAEWGYKIERFYSDSLVATMHAYDKVILFLDLEGPAARPNEIGGIIARRGQIVDAFLGWCPPQIDSKSFHEFEDGRRFCHGLKLEWLKSEGESVENLRTRFYCWVCNWKPVKMVANGIGDICEFLHSYQLNLPIIDIALPQWKDRQYLEEHLEACEAKRRSIPMPNGLCCPYDSAHYRYIAVSSKNPETRSAKQKHGSHCALYDAYEVALYAFNHHLAQV